MKAARVTAVYVLGADVAAVYFTNFTAGLRGAMSWCSLRHVYSHSFLKASSSGLRR